MKTTKATSYLLYSTMVFISTLLFSSISTAQVVTNNDVAVNPTTNTPTFTFSVPAGDNSVLVVALHSGGDITNFTSVAYNGITVTAPSASQVFAVNNMGISIWLIPLGSGPAIAAMNITVTGAVPFRISAASYQNVNQTTLFANATGLNGFQGNSTLPVTTSSADNFVVDAIAANSTVFVPAISVAHANFDFEPAAGQGDADATGAVVNLTWIAGATADIAHIGLELIGVPAMGGNVPTMGQWGLIALALLFMIVGVIAIRTRSVQARKL